jgi:Tautomerase enzyme
MPLIQIDLERDLYEAKHEEISREIHRAQIDALEIPSDDLFQVFRPHTSNELKFDRTYNGVDRQHLLFISITMVHRYSVETKRKLYSAIVERLGILGIRPQDILISVVENAYEDWYAGRL